MFLFKRIIPIILAATLLICLVGCNKAQSNPVDVKETNNEVQDTRKIEQQYKTESTMETKPKEANEFTIETEPKEITKPTIETEPKETSESISEIIIIEDRNKYINTPEENYNKHVVFLGKVILIDANNPEGIYAELENEEGKVGILISKEKFNDLEMIKTQFLKIGNGLSVGGILTAVEGKPLIKLDTYPLIVQY